MKYLLTLYILVACNYLVKAQNHQEIESSDADVLSLNSIGSSATVLNFLNSKAAPTGGSVKRAYISTNGNVLNFGLSNNNTGGRIEFFGQGLKRMTMNADGRFGIGTVNNDANTLFKVDGNSNLDGKIKVGEDASSPDIEGQVRYNSTTNDFEGFNGTSWVSLTSIGNTNSSGETVTDYDGNVYKTVEIGTQTWMRENLKVTHYNDGTPIPEITLQTEWEADNDGAWCWYDNDSRYDNVLGKFYNFYAVEDNNICPAGWHVPTEEDFSILTDYIVTLVSDPDDHAAIVAYLISNGYPNELDSEETWAAHNYSGFTALPAGGRRTGQGFVYKGTGTTFTASDGDDFGGGYNSCLVIDQTGFEDSSGFCDSNWGLSVRCVRTE